MNRGTVKWFNSSKGYGIITMKDGTDIFVHYSGIVSEKKFKYIMEGQTVEFEIVDGEKRKQAVNVSVIAELPEIIVEEDDATMSKEITENDVVEQVTEAVQTMTLASMVTDAIEKVMDEKQAG